MFTYFKTNKPLNSEELKFKIKLLQVFAITTYTQYFKNHNTVNTKYEWTLLSKGK